MEACLYVIPGSHPSRTAQMMLESKGIEYKRVDLLPVISKGVLRVAGFPGITVPALKLDGRKLQGSREIGRELDRLVPEPPLYPAAADARAAVEQAERWGEDVLQPVARRVLWNALRRDRSPLASYSEGARLGVPIELAVKTAAPIVASRRASTRPPTSGCAPTSRRCRGCCSGSTTGSPRGCSAARSSTPRTCRSGPACAC